MLEKMNSRKDGSRLIAFMALIVVFLNVNTTTCICGYMSWTSIPGNVIGASLAGWAFFSGNDDRFITRSMILSGGVIAAMALAKNGIDIIWIGHNPIFP